MGLALMAEGYASSCHISYSSFYIFRKQIGQSIGIDIEEMEGFGKSHFLDKEYKKIGVRSWEEVKSPLKYLLNHSDCEGKLTWEQCELIAPILLMVIFLWEDLFLSDLKKFGFELGEIMEYCASHHKDLEFC